MEIDLDAELLTPDQEINLARDIEVGIFAARALEIGAKPCGASEDELQSLVVRGKSAREELFMANLRMVNHRCVFWERQTGAAYEELLQEGCVGLGEAVLRFDWRRGHRFVTFAYPLVEGAVASFAQSKFRMVEVTRHQLRMQSRIGRAVDGLVQRLGRRPLTAEIAADLGISELVVRQTLKRRVSAPAEFDEKVMLDWRASPDGGQRIDVSWLNQLGERERNILVFRYGIGSREIPRDELARRLGISLSTLRREEFRAIEMARRVLARAGSDGRMEQWSYQHAS